MVDCPWPIDVEDCCESTGLDPENPDDAAKIAAVIAQVSIMLSRWSGFAYGGCKTVRPLSPCGECRTRCCLDGDCIVLHDVSEVLEVRVHGEVVEDWHFDPARGILCAVPPTQWPTADPRFEDVGALEVDVRIGAEPDAWALAVANELACELLLSCQKKQCRLPRNATTVTSQGVTITLTREEIEHLIPAASAWVAAVNPAGATAPARVFSPEAMTNRIVGSQRMAKRFSPWH